MKRIAATMLAFLAMVSTPALAGRTGGADMADDERMERGRAALAGLDTGAEAALHAALDGVAPDMVGLVVGFGYGDVYARPGLGLADRQVATVAALAALGNAEPQLRFHIGGGLNAGLAPAEVVETLYVTTVFAGFPAGLNALATARRVFEERGVRPERAEARLGDRRARGLAALEATSRGAGRAVLESLAPTVGSTKAAEIVRGSEGYEVIVTTGKRAGKKPDGGGEAPIYADLKAIAAV